MCSEQTTEHTLRGWLRDPMIRMVMESDGVTESEMIALVRRIAIATASRWQGMPSANQTPQMEHRGAW